MLRATASCSVTPAQAGVQRGRAGADGVGFPPRVGARGDVLAREWTIGMGCLCVTSFPNSQSSFQRADRQALCDAVLQQDEHHDQGQHDDHQTGK